MRGNQVYADKPWHALDLAAAQNLLQVNARCGLDESEVQLRQAQFGPNALPEPPPRPLRRTFARQFQSPLIYILLIAAVLAVVLEHYDDAGVILVVVLVNAVIGTFQEGRTERSLAALRRLAALRARVQRGGLERTVAARELVPGVKWTPKTGRADKV
jgi:Ca2+-transporting ATPase